MLKNKSFNKTIIILMVFVTTHVFVITPISMEQAYAAGIQATFYVSPDGNDTNPGTESQPFATITKARDVIRTINDNMTGDIIVYLREGKYYIEDTITFNESDSGTNGYKIYYRNYNNEEPEIVGGQKITGWTLHEGNIYKAYVGSNWQPYNMIENGVTCTVARTPNTGYFKVDTKVVEGISFKYKAEDIPDTFDYSDASVMIWVGQAHWDWFTSLLSIDNVDFTNKTIKVNPSTNTFRTMDTGARYYLKGSLDFLDTPGEFYYDQSDGYVYYWSGNDSIDQQEIIAATVNNVIELKGSSTDNHVMNLHFEGLKMVLSNYSNEHWSYQDPGTIGIGDNNEYEHGRYGLFYMENASHNTIRFCKIFNAGFSAIILNYAANNNTIYGNWIQDAGYNGIYLTGWGPNRGGFANITEAYVNHNNIISNNYIYNCGLNVGHGSGVQLYMSGNNEISYNEINRMPRYGISLKGQRWGTQPSTYYGETVTFDNHYDFNLCKDNVIKYNDMYDLCNDSGDCGAVEGWGTGKGNYVFNNRLHDYYNDVSSYAFFGFMNDDDSDYYTLENNLVYNWAGTRAFQNNGNSNLTYINNHHSTNEQDAMTKASQNGIDWDNVGLKGDFPFDTSLVATVLLPTKYEAEKAVLSGGASINTNHTGYSGTGFIDGYGSTGAATTFSVNTSKTGHYEVVLRYSGEVSERTLGVYVNGTKALDTNLPPTSDWDSWASKKEVLTLDEGLNTITYKNDAGNNGVANLDYIIVTPCTVEPITIEAEDYDSMNGVNLHPGDQVVGWCDDGDWLCYNNINLGNGYNELVVKVAVDPAYAGKRAEIRLDSVTGTLIGTLTIGDTGSWDTFQEQTISLTGGSGVHDIYVVFKDGSGVGNFDWFRFDY
ncbi:carbohydrate-binding protein [Vallitalea guaymasensis]|uniref:carbohydrate-binding protein n=1 Tax=Vallitalea guaymasensis TaxID=1185412 RepID=UPI00272AD81F|nr:carbohydrate-binding protein [Vallitalea guaymasensis]